MSCSSCSCNPCTCDDVCDPNNEPLASALNNFIASFFGSISKTCVDNQVQWILPCDLNTGLPGFGRRQGEGVACYLLRLFEYLNTLQAGISISDEGVVISDPANSINFVGDGVVATAAGGDVTVTITQAAPISVADEGIVIANPATQLDFVGDGVVATAVGGVVTITITQPPPPSCAAFYDQIAINGVCYDTWQAAYDANIGAAVPTLMLVGQTTAFGGLTLAANYNSNIIISGFGAAISQLGSITGNGFTIDITAYNVTFV